MNQIYLGQRAFGFASAAQIYFGKDIKDITVAEAAMLAGLPKAPSAYNPVVNPKRARTRQQYILQRMHSSATSPRPSTTTAKARAAEDQDRQQRVRRACRIRGRDGAPAGVRAVQGRNLHARPERVHHDHQGRPGRGLPGAAARRDGIRTAPPVPRPGSLHRHPEGQGRSRRSDRKRTGRASRQRRHHRRRRAGGLADRNHAP